MTQTSFVCLPSLACCDPCFLPSGVKLLHSWLCSLGTFSYLPFVIWLLSFGFYLIIRWKSCLTYLPDLTVPEGLCNLWGSTADSWQASVVHVRASTFVPLVLGQPQRHSPELSRSRGWYPVPMSTHQGCNYVGPGPSLLHHEAAMSFAPSPLDPIRLGAPFSSIPKTHKFHTIPL